MLTALRQAQGEPERQLFFNKMETKNIIRTFITSALLIILVVFAAGVYAETLEISGNASNSNSSIQLNQNNSVNINQSNSADVNNSVNIKSNTGGNSISGGVGDGSITTGNITNNVNINNQLNSNVADVKCKNCITPTPTKKPGVSPTPTTPPGANGKPGDGGRGGDGDGDGGPGGVGGPSQAVLGLAQTSGENSLVDLLKLLPALTSLTLGYGLLRKNA